MAINFPDSPATNDLFTSNGKTWEYDGTAWTIKAATTSIATESITYDKLAADAVTTVRLQMGLLQPPKLLTELLLPQKLHQVRSQPQR